MTKRTPQQKRRATAKMLEKKLPASPKVQGGEVVLSKAEIRRAIRDLGR